jgi:hypothetical protein
MCHNQLFAQIYRRQISFYGGGGGRGGRKKSYDIRPHTTRDLKRQRFQKTAPQSQAKFQATQKKRTEMEAVPLLKLYFQKATSTETDLPNP